MVVICMGARLGFNPSVPVAPSVARPSPASDEFDEPDELDELDAPNSPDALNESVDVASDVGSLEVSSVGLSTTSSNEDVVNEVEV